MFWRLCSWHETVNIINPKGHRIVIFASVEKRERNYADLIIKMTSGSVSKEREKNIGQQLTGASPGTIPKTIADTFQLQIPYQLYSSYWESRNLSFLLVLDKHDQYRIYHVVKRFFCARTKQKILSGLASRVASQKTGNSLLHFALSWSLPINIKMLWKLWTQQMQPPLRS